MIAATDVRIDRDLAWWVADFNSVAGLDRPCDWCFDGFYPMWDRNDDEIECPDCDGTGQHWFDIETLEHHHEPGESWCTSLCSTRTLRVSVVEVLQIVDSAHSHGIPENCIDMRDGKKPRRVTTLWWHHIVLPESAAPGKYAVRLRVKV